MGLERIISGTKFVKVCQVEGDIVWINARDIRALWTSEEGPKGTKTALKTFEGDMGLWYYSELQLEDMVQNLMEPETIYAQVFPPPDFQFECPAYGNTIRDAAKACAKSFGEMSPRLKFWQSAKGGLMFSINGGVTLWCRLTDNTARTYRITQEPDPDGAAGDEVFP